MKPSFSTKRPPMVGLLTIAAVRLPPAPVAPAAPLPPVPAVTPTASIAPMPAVLPPPPVVRVVPVTAALPAPPSFAPHLTLSVAPAPPLLPPAPTSPSPATLLVVPSPAAAPGPPTAGAATPAATSFRQLLELGGHVLPSIQQHAHQRRRPVGVPLGRQERHGLARGARAPRAPNPVVCVSRLKAWPVTRNTRACWWSNAKASLPFCATASHPWSSVPCGSTRHRPRAASSIS